MVQSWPNFKFAFSFLHFKISHFKNAGVTYLNSRRSTRHINLNIFVVNRNVSESFSHRKTVYLVNMYEPKTKSANFVTRIQIYFKCNSLWTNTGNSTYFTPFSSVSVVHFEQVNASWVFIYIQQVITCINPFYL